MKRNNLYIFFIYLYFILIFLNFQHVSFAKQPPLPDVRINNVPIDQYSEVLGEGYLQSFKMSLYIKLCELYPIMKQLSASQMRELFVLNFSIIHNKNLYNLPSPYILYSVPYTHRSHITINQKLKSVSNLIFSEHPEQRIATAKHYLTISTSSQVYFYYQNHHSLLSDKICCTWEDNKIGVGETQKEDKENAQLIGAPLEAAEVISSTFFQPFEDLLNKHAEIRAKSINASQEITKKWNNLSLFKNEKSSIVKDYKADHYLNDSEIINNWNKFSALYPLVYSVDEIESNFQELLSRLQKVQETYKDSLKKLLLRSIEELKFSELTGSQLKEMLTFNHPEIALDDALKQAQGSLAGQEEVIVKRIHEKSQAVIDDLNQRKIEYEERLAAAKKSYHDQFATLKEIKANSEQELQELQSNFAELERRRATILNDLEQQKVALDEQRSNTLAELEESHQTTHAQLTRIAFEAKTQVTEQLDKVQKLKEQQGNGFSLTFEPLLGLAQTQLHISNKIKNLDQVLQDVIHGFVQARIIEILTMDDKLFKKIRGNIKIATKVLSIQQETTRVFIHFPRNRYHLSVLVEAEIETASQKRTVSTQLGFHLKNGHLSINSDSPINEAYRLGFFNTLEEILKEVVSKESDFIATLPDIDSTPLNCIEALEQKFNSLLTKFTQ